MTWQIALYALVLGLVTILLVPLSNQWWLVLLFGAAAPVALAIVRARAGHADPGGMEAKARELLGAVADHRELTAAEAAQWTACTAAEASHLLESLAREGRLIRLSRDGRAVYALPGRELAGIHREAVAPGEDMGGVTGEAAPPPLDEPLSEREREVLALLASGRTNAEAARELFISIGTVKSHTANIYRKLGARNRAEAVSRARDLGLLP